MTVNDQYAHCDLFFRSALALIDTKGRDYAPEDVPLIDVFLAAAELNVSPEAIIWVHLRKQMAAIRQGITGDMLRSESLTSRCTDVANYAAILTFVNTYRAALLNDLDSHLTELLIDDAAQRAEIRAWIQRQRAKHGYTPDPQ